MILEGYIFLNCFLITTNNYNQQLQPTITSNNYNQQLQPTITNNNYIQQLQPTITTNNQHCYSRQTIFISDPYRGALEALKKKSELLIIGKYSNMEVKMPY